MKIKKEKLFLTALIIIVLSFSGVFILPFVPNSKIQMTIEAKKNSNIIGWWKIYIGDDIKGIDTDKIFGYLNFYLKPDGKLTAKLYREDDKYRIDVIENITYDDGILRYDPNLSGIFTGKLSEDKNSIHGEYDEGYKIYKELWVRANDDESKKLEKFYNDESPIEYKYCIPEKFNDGLEVSSLSAQGIDSIKIIQASDLILKDKFIKIHSLLIIKNGKLVFEEYYNGFHRNKKHDLRSITKSVISALIGIAIDQNAIKNVDEKMFSFFPEYSEFKNEYNTQIKLYHLLTMTAGFKWDETSNTYKSRKNTEMQRYNSRNWIKFTLEREMLGMPGYAADKVGFIYCGGCPTLLSAIIGKTTGNCSKLFAEKFLFKPLGIINFDWYNDSKEITDGATGLWLIPRDMAKIGLLYLNKGRWQGKQIISEKWIDESLKRHVFFSNKIGYGYLWWLKEININGEIIYYYYGSGNGGQKIVVCPELELVVVLTGGNYEKPLAHRQANEIIDNYILKAIIK